MRVLVAMSGGVDSSVAAALLRDEGHDVVGVTMKLWGGASDAGCCSVSDVDDARRVADHLGIEHHVFNFGEAFDRDVVDGYVAAHEVGDTPNPCIECNRHIKFDRLLRRADALGFDRIATGHHARVVSTAGGLRIARGADAAKDQSYVLHMLDQRILGRLLLPIGELAKDEVRRRAEQLGLRVASKSDSQDVCFITKSVGRAGFMRGRARLDPGVVVDADGVEVGHVPAVQLVTIGQRRGLGVGGGGEPRYAVDVDVEARRVVVGSASDLLVERTPLRHLTWVGAAVPGAVAAQTSAHGTAVPASVQGDMLLWHEPHRRVAPGRG